MEPRTGMGPGKTQLANLGVGAPRWILVVEVDERERREGETRGSAKYVLIS